MKTLDFKKWSIYGFIFISIAGTLSHFLYDLLGQAVIIGLFNPINESVWEHLKMIFWPMFFFSLFYLYIKKEKINNFFSGWAFGVLLSEIFILAFFYGYNAILGKEFLVLDIISFFLAAGICQYINYKITTLKPLPKIHKFISIILLVVMVSLSTIFTFTPPKTPLFFDKQSQSYGIQK